MRYIGKNIYFILKNHKKMFIFMLMVQIVSVMLFMYCYGIIQSKRMKQNEFYDVQCEFRLGFLKRDRTTNEYSLEEKYKFRDIKKIMDEMCADMGDEILYVSLCLAESEEALNEKITCPLCCYPLTKESYQILCKDYGEQPFSWDEMINGCGKVWINSMQRNSEGLKLDGEDFVFSGKRFEAVMDSGVYQIQMAYGDIPDEAYVTGIDLYLNKAPDINKQKEVNAKLKDWFGIEEREIGQPYGFEDFLERGAIILTMAVSIFICLIIVVNALLIYRYMLEKRKKWIFVMHLNGCGYGRICFYFVAEMAMVMVLCFAAALLLYHKFIFPIAGGEIVMDSVIYEGRLYLYSLITYVIVTLLGCLICAGGVISNYRKKIVSVLEEAKIWEN